MSVASLCRKGWAPFRADSIPAFFSACRTRLVIAAVCERDGREEMPCDSHNVAAPRDSILDFYRIDDRVHGLQEGRHFHGYYYNFCLIVRQ